MALSKQVESSLDEAQSNLRNALAFSARSEHPAVLEALTKVMNDLERIKMLDKFQAELDKLKGVDGPTFL